MDEVKNMNWSNVVFIVLFFYAIFFFLQVTNVFASESIKANMDNSIKPGDDFFEYANGNWLKKHPIPADKSKYSAFNELRDKTDENLKKIVEKYSNKKNLKYGSCEQKIATFYNLGMDVKKRDKDGLRQIVNELKMIGSIKDRNDFIKITAKLQTMGIPALFSISSDSDPDDSNIVIARIWQSGLGMPDRDYYLKSDNDSKNILKRYREYVKNVLIISGEDEKDAVTDAGKIIDMETKLAEIYFSRVENRDIKKITNKMNLEQVQELTPDFEWRQYLDQIRYTDIKTFNVAQVSFLKRLNDFLKTASIDDLKLFLKWKLFDTTSAFLSSDLEKENFNFFGATLEGKKKMLPRWKRVLEITNATLGFSIGKVYVKEYFPLSAKKRMEKLVDNLRKSLSVIIINLSWMSPQTKEKALEKLSSIDVKIGYPDKWPDYSKLDIKNDYFASNILRSMTFDFNYGPSGLDKIGKPLDRTVWLMFPQTVNAYYEPSKNEICFPAGILQPPFFDMNMDDAPNYGAIGVVIGHEITHGFDDQGSQYDKYGNVMNWWTKEDMERFRERSKAVVEQYNRYEVLPGIFINGELTLGENIADIGGLNISFLAYQLSLKNKKTPPVIDGFNANQRFFLSYASIWRTNIRDEALKNQVKTDPHSPAKYRVNGALFDNHDFYKAFPDIKQADKLFIEPSKRVIMWGIEK